MTTLPRHLADKGFELYAPGVARRVKRNDVGTAAQKWEWLARKHSGWVRAASERHARQLRQAPS